MPRSQDSYLEKRASSLLAGQDLTLSSVTVIQSLWAGYGKIARVQAISKSTSSELQTANATNRSRSFILKLVKPPSAGTDEGHLRKLISYQVEQYFYQYLAPQLPSSIAVAECVASSSSSSGPEIALLLADLRSSYPVAGEKRGDLDEAQVYAALRWLGWFHGFWWARKVECIKWGQLRKPPLEEGALSEAKEGVWLNGGYTYLATRLIEYASLQANTKSEWSKKLCTPNASSCKSIAELAADVLSPSNIATAEYQTLIHGDVKSENLFTTPSSGDSCSAAFFDFQYTGLGLGLCDLAKLFTCSVPVRLLTQSISTPVPAIPMGDGEECLLQYYRHILQEASGKKYPWELLVSHWETALVDWLRFQASWGFWGNVLWLEGRVRKIIEDEHWVAWLEATAANG